MKKYDPKEVFVNFGTATIDGFADGTFVEIEPSADTFSSEVGADGQVIRVRSHDSRAMARITLLQSSGSNDVLSGFHTADKAVDGTGILPFLIKDGNGSTTLASARGWIKKLPNVSYSGGAETRVWEIELEIIDGTVGGSSDV